MTPGCTSEPSESSSERTNRDVTDRRARAARQRWLALAASAASTIVVFGVVGWLISRR